MITPTITPSDSSLHSSAAPPPPSPPPAAALEGIWELLDVLPQAESPPDLSATTIEMVALSLAGGKSTTHSFARTWQRGSTGRWAIAAAAVMGALVLGVLAGRASLPSPSARLIAFLPIAQHVDLLVEAGSVTFLQALAAQPYPPPRQFDAFQLKGDAQFNAAMDSLRRLQAVRNSTDNAVRPIPSEPATPATPATPAERHELEKNVETFQRLSSTRRRELLEVARQLADPQQEDLRNAARLWHQWIASRDPADRRDIIELNTQQRLEWLDRYAQRDSRPINRPPREFDRDPRRGPPGQRPPGPRPRGPGAPPFPPPDRPRASVENPAPLR